MTSQSQMECLRYAALLVLVLAPLAGAEETTPAEDGQRFVAVGQIARVTKDGVRPRYVLLDEHGEVTASLRPTEGFDMREFVGQEVGVTARTLVSGDTPILLAESVTTFGEARQISPVDIDQEVALASHDEYVDGSMPVSSVVTSMGPEPATVYPETAYEPIVSQEIPLDGYVVDGASCGIDGCDSCGGGCGDPGCISCAACPCGLPGTFWLRGEHLIWWTKGMDTPALVTSSTPGTARSNAGVLGFPSTQTLYGGEPLFDQSRPGARFRIGKWCDMCNWVGFETDFFFLSDDDQDFTGCDVGPTIYARPFFNVNTGEEDSELVQFPGVLNGSLHIDAENVAVVDRSPIESQSLV